MKNREFAGLLITLSVLVVLLLIVANPFKSPVKQKVDPLFPKLRTKEPALILVNGRNKLRMWREGAEWLVTGDKDSLAYPADTSGVFSAIRALRSATKKELVSSNPEKRGLFQVDTTGTAVKVMAADSSVLADFVIGKSGRDYATNYVRPSGGDAVYLVGDRMKSQFDRSYRVVRDVFVFRTPKEDITKIRISRGDTVISLQLKDDGSWEMLSPKQGTLKKDYATRLVNVISNFRGDEVRAAGADETRFERPFLTVNVVLRNGSDHTITIGDTVRVEGRRVARLEGRRWVHEIGTYRLETLTKAVDEMLEPPPAPVDSAAVAPPTG